MSTAARLLALLVVLVVLGPKPIAANVPTFSHRPVAIFEYDAGRVSACRYDDRPEDLKKSMCPVASRPSSTTGAWCGEASSLFRHHFTGKERDGETGLDYFGARYMSAAQGRFTSPDPLPGWEKDPQSWNMYSYGRNNPLKYIDPTGETYEVCDANGQNCGTISDAQFDKFRKDKNLNFRGGSSGSIYAGDALSGTFRQTDVDLDPGVAQALHAAGVVADREVKKFARDVAITAATGVVFSGAAAAVAKIGSAVPENLPLLRQVSEVVSKGNLKHIRPCQFVSVNSLSNPVVRFKIAVT